MNRYGSDMASFCWGNEMKRVQSSPGRPLLPVVHSLCLKSQLLRHHSWAPLNNVRCLLNHGMTAWRHDGMTAGKHTDIRHHGTVDQTRNKMKEVDHHRSHKNPFIITHHLHQAWTWNDLNHPRPYMSSVQETQWFQYTRWILLVNRASVCGWLLLSWSSPILSILRINQQGFWTLLTWSG